MREETCSDNPAFNHINQRSTAITTRAIGRKLKQAQIALDNARTDADLAEALATFGYNPARLQQGNLLREAAQTHMQRQYALYGNFIAAQDAYKESWRQTRLTYMDYIKIARVALKDDRGVRQVLGLAAPRRYDLAGWITQAQLFYKAALADTDILSRLAIFGITSAMLELGRQQVAMVDAQDATRQQQKGSAFDATRQRDAAFVALEEWMRDFVKSARMALKGRPQLLAQLGITALAAPRRGRAAAPATPAPENTPAPRKAAAIPSDTLTSDQPPLLHSNGHAVVSG
jgi:hypothetical protein